MSLLSREEFLATFNDPMVRVPAEEQPSIDFWPYFESISQRDFEGHDCSSGQVEYAWRDSSGRFEHVLVDSEDRNVFMLLVLDRLERTVYGHRLLDLNREYGLTP
jgi:hypothetical protein